MVKLTNEDWGFRKLGFAKDFWIHVNQLLLGWGLDVDLTKTEPEGPEADGPGENSSDAHGTQKCRQACEEIFETKKWGGGNDLKGYL